MGNDTFAIELKYWKRDEAWSKRLPFPVVYVALDMDEVRFISFVPDDFQRKYSLTAIQIKEMISNVLRVDAWEQERDAAFRGTELYGSLNLIQANLGRNKVFFSND